MTDIAIRVENLGKVYRIGVKEKRPANRWQRARQLAASPFSYLRRMGRPPTEEETLWALKDVSFEVQRGEVLGIIGRNGAGKSTLLKILSRITEPTRGRVILDGRVASLLEVGTGFHPELTGRENIYLNGAILGMHKAEIDRKFDDIVAFSEIERFLDTPVKRYSSGMYVRLAFAVAAHLEPEILLVDEVLAVGDAGFQKKALGKIQGAIEQGRTVLFVSHNLAAVTNLCDRSILLSEGQLRFDGESDQAVERYLKQRNGEGQHRGGYYDLSNRDPSDSSEALLIRRLTIQDETGQITDMVRMGCGMSIIIDTEGCSRYREAQVGVMINSTFGQRIANFNTGMSPPAYPDNRSICERFVLRIAHVPFIPGLYSIDISVAQKGVGRLDYVPSAATIQVLEADVYGSGYHPSSGDGVVFLDAHWKVQ